MRGGILLATINAKWIHPSLALRLLKANLGPLEQLCEIAEFALRQPLSEKTGAILAAKPRILGLSVSIWNHAATLELLKELGKTGETGEDRPVVILGGPEVSHLTPEAEIFRHADYCVRGEGETAFRRLCEAVLPDGTGNIGGWDSGISRREGEKVFSEKGKNFSGIRFIDADNEKTGTDGIQSGYRLYSGEDLQKKLVYVEASRGCPYFCEFCLSGRGGDKTPAVREFPLEPFFDEMESLFRRGARAFKFLDRSFNADTERARLIMEFFLEKIIERTAAPAGGGRAAPGNVKPPPAVHFEMVPLRFPPELVETAARFPAGTLRLEIGIQTLDPAVSARIGRPSSPEKELAALRLLREKTAAIIHADLIAGLPGEGLTSFGRGFDLLYAALRPPLEDGLSDNRGGREKPGAEIQPGILKLLPGAKIARHATAFGMRFNPSPPYELLESAALPGQDLDRVKNFARFWELLANRGLLDPGPAPVFERFMALSDSLLARFGRNWGIAKNELLEAVDDILKLETE